MFRSKRSFFRVRSSFSRLEDAWHAEIQGGMKSMTLESWFVLTVAAAFLLLGVAGSPLAWVAMHHRKSRLEQLVETRWKELASEMRRLDDRLAQAEEAGRLATGKRELTPGETATNGRSHPNRPFLSSWRRISENRVELNGDEPPMIAVPDLGSRPDERDSSSSPLSQRYAAIWTLADQGASPEVIARATGQPIGQIELILGLRRHIDGSRTTIPHAPHA
jgi:hypothetical protein